MFVNEIIDLFNLFNVKIRIMPIVGPMSHEWGLITLPFHIL